MDRKFKCSQCSKSFAHISSLSRHKREHSKVMDCGGIMKNMEGGLMDSGNDFGVMNSGVKREHSKLDSGLKEIGVIDNGGEEGGVGEGDTMDRQFKCSHCSMSFSHQSSLSRHKRVHPEVVPNKCPQCSKAFKFKSGLSRHKREHSKLMKSYFREVGVIDNGGEEGGVMESCISDGSVMEQQFKCSHCSKSFSLQSSLSRHKRVHPEVVPNKCPQCSKSFKFKSGLSRHKREHSKMMNSDFREVGVIENGGEEGGVMESCVSEGGVMERQFKCSHCSKSFSLQSSLSRHKRVHPEVVPNKCPQCSKAFKFKSCLSRHKREHSKVMKSDFREVGVIKNGGEEGGVMERQFKCSHCSKSFSRQSNLSRHKRVHPEMVLNRFSLCSKAFRFKSSLSRHKREHSKVYERDYREVGVMESGDEIVYFNDSNDREVSVLESSFSKVGVMGNGDELYFYDSGVKQDGVMGSGVGEGDVMECGGEEGGVMESSGEEGDVMESGDEEDGVMDKKFKCSQCSKSFSHQPNLSRHKRKHPKLLPSCLIFVKKFSSLQEFEEWKFVRPSQK